jgi:hypothetical protein
VVAGAVNEIRRSVQIAYEGRLPPKWHLLLLKQVRNWSFDTLERDVRMNLAYRYFARF